MNKKQCPPIKKGNFYSNCMVARVLRPWENYYHHNPCSPTSEKVFQPHTTKLKHAFKHQRKNIVKGGIKTYSFRTNEDGIPLPFLKHVN